MGGGMRQAGIPGCGWISALKKNRTGSQDHENALLLAREFKIPCIR